MQENFYALLGVSPTAGEDEIRRAYRDLVAEAMDDQPRFQALSEAFEVLKDPQRRLAYDQKRTALAIIPNAQKVADANATGAFVSPSTGIALPTVCPISLSPCPLKTGNIVPDEGFCPECGVLIASLGANVPVLNTARTPYLVDTAGREYPLRVGDNLVGREGADVVLPDKSVSRRHAQFDVQKSGAVTLTELGSTNGSRRGATPLVANQTVALSDGDELRFGAVRLTVRIPEPATKAIGGSVPASASAPVIAPKPPAALPSKLGVPTTGARLTGTGGNTLTFAIGQAAETTVGRKPENALIITGDAYVSSKHAVIVYENNRYKVIDVGSTNGTRWNGRKLLPQVPQTLSDGDEIVFGQTAFLFSL
ncbi:MAG: FHA domain-containing protein [Armatimonadetes bacterium]|nr:FHA domain-containing protein [Armatimonadota bacterium]